MHFPTISVQGYCSLAFGQRSNYRKWDKKNVCRRKKTMLYVSLCQNFTRRAVLSSFFSSNIWIPMKFYCLFVWCLNWTVTSVFASYNRFLMETEMKFIHQMPWYNLKPLMKSKISYKQYLPCRHDLKFLMTSEFPRASQWSVGQMQAVSRYSRNQRCVIFRSRNFFTWKKYLSRY